MPYVSRHRAVLVAALVAVLGTPPVYGQTPAAPAPAPPPPSALPTPAQQAAPRAGQLAGQVSPGPAPSGQAGATPTQVPAEAAPPPAMGPAAAPAHESAVEQPPGIELTSEHTPLTPEDAGWTLTRYVATVGMGVPVRLTPEEQYGQGTFAPVFLDGFAAIVFPVGSIVQHGLGLGGSIGMTEDGGFWQPTPAGSQVVIMPAYVAYLLLDEDLTTMAHLGVPVLVRGGSSAGVELAATLGYRMLAGFGIYGELGVAGFAGGKNRFNMTTSLELGLFVDYEVLP